ncbi:UxaA family hydrolase [Alicyclobacillus fastidiosus]|uniref:UxaA family hydrolase n=1 Tax=Alicyclobacillus fastidiosus TaxID=392011 RepID=A0ABV5AJZ4_9BACL|nr:UxaA family hydrolase [Alicyclobacillus fastidiosus]WEH08259.1 UxaA family hydrolase [Alicyclobacillus fastidiosus]
MLIDGYLREDGRIGVRNHVLVLPVSYEMNQIAEKIVAGAQGAVTFRNQHGINQAGDDLDQTLRVYEGFATHPNVYGVVILAWGHEPFDLARLVSRARAAGKQAELVSLTQVGGISHAVARGTELANEWLVTRDSVQRVQVPLANILLGTECGGSDACSGISGNPALGVVSDLLVTEGGTSILSETTELIGAEHLLAARAATPEIGEQVIHIVHRLEENAMKMGVDIRGAQPSPGNMDGGITTIEEKSLGCIYKGGTTPIQEVIEYAERPSKHGLVIMDTPGHDIEQITGMVAGGAQVVIFTTGRGTPTGSPIAPCIKVATNSATYLNMEDNLDFNSGPIVDGLQTVEENGNALFETMIAVLNGELTKSELLGHREFGIYRIGKSL